MANSKTDGSGIERERVAASVLTSCIALEEAADVLVCHDDYGFTATELTRQGFSVHTWWRAATADHGASAWPTAGAYRAATLRLSKDKTAFAMALHAVCSVLPPATPVWVYGANDEGIKSAGKVMGTVLSDVHTVDTRKHCRVLLGHTTADATVQRSLDSWAMRVPLEHASGTIEHTVFPGVFAKGKLDPATQLLLETLPTPVAPLRVLDYACGAGVIGGWMLRHQTDTDLTQLDADAVAAKAAAINVPKAHTIVGASLDDLADADPFDCIVSNPPIHIGKSRDYGVLRHLITGSRAHLKPRGSLWIVVQRQADIGALLGRNFSRSGIAAETTRFRVWKAE